VDEGYESPDWGFGISICFSSLAPLQNFSPPFRLRFLVLDRSSNAERGSEGEVEMVLIERTNLHFTKTTNEFCPVMLTLF